jgi:hypothetical protein
MVAALNVMVLAAAVAAVATLPASATEAAITAAHPYTLGGRPCQPLMEPIDGPDLPLGLLGTCSGVRPGSPVRTPLGICSLNFMFRGSDDATYMGTAGHCLLNGTGTTEVAYKPGEGPPAADAARNPIGRFAYAVQDGRRDFALIRLDPGVPASPQVCHFGGPTGVNADTGAVATLGHLDQFGQGRLFGALIPARTQLAVEADPDQILSAGLAAPGDSGSPLMSSDGRAMGVVVATGPAVLGIVGTGFVFSTRLAPQLAHATEVTGVRYDLQTAPRLI